MEIKNKTVLVTGASRGIGEAVARELSRRSARLVLASRTSNPGFEQELRDNGSPEVKSFSVDLSNADGVDRFCEELEGKGLAIDCLVNNAGQLSGGLFENQSINDIDLMLQVNLHAVLRLSRFLLPGMLDRGLGKIVNNASVSGKMFFPCASTYAASKAAIVAFTESLKQELRGTGVSTLLLITPGVKTQMYDDISTLYGDNLELDFLSYIEASEWATQVCDAIEDDRNTLWPPGSNRLGVFMGHHFPTLFQRLVRNKFHR